MEFIPNPKKLNQFVGYTTVPHNFYIKDFVTISGLSTGTFDNNSVKPIGVTTSRFKLNVGISSAGATGLTTYFNVDGKLDELNILYNDLEDRLMYNRKRVLEVINENYNDIMEINKL